MYFKDLTGAVHSLTAEDIERGRTFISVPKLNAMGEPVLQQVRNGINGELLFNGDEPVMEIVLETVEGPNTTLALLPAGSVQITDAEAHAIQNPPETIQQAAARLQAFVQGHMDAAARAAGYDDIKTAVTYADEPAVPAFQAQGRAFRTWRSLVWASCYSQLAAAEASQVVPTESDVLERLPALELPA